MSGPYRFTHESARSPLDRRAQVPAPADQPVSYKTNVNRAKTKKWVEAKKNAYDGDDWGDYDEYDEYGADQPAVPAMPPPPAPKGYGQRFDQPARSFTDPRQPAAPFHPARRNSFEAGEEQRAFSASLATSPVDDYARTPFGNPPHAPAPTQPPYRQPSGAESDISDTPQHRRDFNPAALPPPLTTRVSTGPPTAPTSSPFPPRKSSIGQVESPVATSPRARAPSNPNKPLPFVRPSDIYKRHEEDKQRTSMDSTRPAIDSLDTTSPPTSNQGASAEAGRSLQPLETVSERKNQHFPSNDATQHNQEGSTNQSSSQQWLPPVESLASFDNDFWPGGQQSQSLNPANNAPHTSPPGDQGFRSVVDQAFVRNDEQRSVPPTPISKSDSGVSRSNTDSTAGISPIMSRVPSGATAALKSRNQNGEGSTPVIVEEIGETGTPTSPPPNTNIRGSISSPMHSRNISNSSIPLATPASIESPARSPVIAPQRNVPEPESAQISTLASPVSQASTREADMASAVLKNPDMPAPELGALEKESQKAYLASHDAQSPVSDVLPQSRSESPSKGRVQALAGKFGDVSPSRRGSTQSMESWENSRNNSRPSSPLKANAPNVQDPTSRPITEREASFRPKLPGQWESYATSAATPYESDKELGKPKGAGLDNGASMPLQDVDFTPTTAKHSIPSTEPSDPLMALKVAGAAAADALQASFDSQSSENPTRDIPHGDVLPRPLLVERTPSAMSSIPPTPPAKDTPGSEEPPPLPPLKEKALLPESRRTSGAHGSLERPAMLPQLSMDPSAEDHESDRLRKEIVASLTPQRSAEPMLQPTPPLGREHDGYFAGGSPQTPASQDAAHVRSTEGAPGTSKADPDPSIEAPSLLTRFSWENKAAYMPTPQGQTHPDTDNQASRDVDHQGNISPPSVEPVTESQSQKPATTGNEVGVNAPSTPNNLSTRIGSPVSPPTGLHVVNSADDPEAVDLPPRLNPDAAPATSASLPKAETPEQKTPEKPTTALRTSQLAPSTANSQSPSAKSPTDKPLGFRDIVNMKSSSDRITTYNQTRDYWAHADHGLSAWVSSAMDANPELVSQPFTPSQPIRVSSASIRHRPTGSISLFGKHHSSQQAESGSPSTSHTPSASASNSFYGGSGGRNASIQMQTKGKDFLHTAGVLGGKGMTGAKGLFAKGKSRFKSDKVPDSPSEASSREGSEEPELVSATPERQGRMSVSYYDSPIREEKKRRRFSSPFHRSSRSRSRPNSIILPSNLYFVDFTNSHTPKSTPPPRETTPSIVSEALRHSTYQAPDDWERVPEATTVTSISSPTPIGAERLTAPERLGVLPSPAKSAYSFLPHEQDGQEDDVPPVPRVPSQHFEDDAERLSEGEERNSGRGTPSQKLLESIVRYSTPPTVTEHGVLISEGGLSRRRSADSEDVSGGNAITNDDDDDDGIGNRCRVEDDKNDDDLPPRLTYDATSARPATIDDAGSFLPYDSLAVGQVSPASSVGANRPNGGDQGDSTHHCLQPGQRLTLERHLYMGDVSPLLPPARLTPDHPKDEESRAPAATRPAYETELIGGDVSPISRQTTATTDMVDIEPGTIASEDRLCTSPPAMATTPPPATVGVVEPHASSSSPLPLPSQATALEMQDALTPRAADVQRPRYPERLSASRIQVVHAVQYVPSRSQSSFETLDQDTVHSQSDGSLLEDQPVDDDAHPPVPQLPPRLGQGPQQSQSPVASGIPEHQKGPPVVISITKSPALASPLGSVPTQAKPDQSPPTETSFTANKPTESMLSRLSSMVSSDGASVSPASSQHTGSPSPSVNPYPAASPAKISRIPAQIVQERTSHVNGNVASDDDFDLYADQDGVVKGVRDESGKPLRIVSPIPSPKMRHPSQPAQPNSSSVAQPVTADDGPSRNSEERPMSFVSGPRDSNGRPQDQINRPNPASAERLNLSPQRSPPTRQSNGGAYAASPLGQRAPKANGKSNQQPSRPREQHAAASHDLHPNGSRSPISNFVVSPIQPSAVLNPPQIPADSNTNRTDSHSPAVQDLRSTQDPRLIQDPRSIFGAQKRATSSGQPIPQDTPSQGQNIQHDATKSAPKSLTNPNHPMEVQRMMAQQAMDSRPRHTQQQRPESPTIQPELQSPPRKDERPSVRPKISAVLKGLGKTHAHNPGAPPQQPLQPPPADDGRLSASRDSSPGSGRRSASYQSNLGESQEHAGPRKQNKSSGFPLFSNRPESTGTASHVSHDSTRVQPSDSRFNLTSPNLPPNFVGIPPQQPPLGSFPGITNSQGYGSQALAAPEPGKKKRFSALGNLFSRNKEDKKALKAKKHSTLPPMQSGQPWPPQSQQQSQQQHFRPQHRSMEYGANPSGRPFPGMSSMPPQFVGPVPSQGVPPRTMPQQPVQSVPSGFQQQMRQQSPQPYQQHSPQDFQQFVSQPGHAQQLQQQHQPLRQESSAYIDTRLLAQQQHQFAVPQSQQPSDNVGVVGVPLHHQHQGVIRSGGTAQAPLEGYYISETKLPDHRQGIPQTSAQQNFHHPQQQQAPATQPPSSSARHHSNHSDAHGPNNIFSASQRRPSPTANEPRYETPAIPPAYTQVSGAYVSPNVEEPPPNAQSRDQHPSPTHYHRQLSEPQMQPLSPQISALTQAPSNPRHNSEASSVSLVSPISNSPPSMANPDPVQNHKSQNPRMTSITEQSHAERPWNLNLPQGATEQEIVRARQRQYMEQQLLAQEQLYAERTGRSPSPRSNTTQSPSPRPSQQQFAHPLSQNGGYRELLPRSSPKPYPRSHALRPRASEDILDPEKEMLARSAAQSTPSPGRTSTPTTYPLPMSPDSVHLHSPVNPMASSMPPPAPPDVSHSPMAGSFSNHLVQSPQAQHHPHQNSPRYEEHVAPDEQYLPPVQHQADEHQQPNYEQPPPVYEPPPYSGPAMPNLGMEKERQDRHRPPNIVTNADDRGRHLEPRQRQISIGMLQHPQPASMAASPSRSSADMGAESLRRQLLHQEESERQERLRRAQIQREESLREREERERARARARVLERSASGGGRVPSLRSDAGSTRATGSGWERRRGSTSRPVFELSAEDDEPVMRATSFPGQEWVPTFTDD